MTKQKKEQTSCGTCGWWRETRKREHVGKCEAPLPDSLEYSHKTLMSDDSGTNCACWKKALVVVHQNAYVFVCADCLCASCWDGIVQCEHAASGGEQHAVVLRRAQAVELAREHATYFDAPSVRATLFDYTAHRLSARAYKKALGL